MEEKTQVKEKSSINFAEMFKKFFSGYSVIIIAIVLFVVAAIIERGSFLTVNNLLNILRNNAVLGVLALGMAFVIIVGEIDLSVGSELVLVASVSLGLLNRSGSTILAVLIAMVLGIGLSVGQGVIVAKGRVPSFVVTLGGMYIFRSVCQYFLNGGGFYGNVDSFGLISNSYLWKIPMPIIYLAIVFAVYLYISKCTKMGRHFYAVGSNERASKLSGLNVSKVKILAFVMMGISVGAAAIIESSRMMSINASSSGSSYEMYAIAMAVIGGVSMNGGRGKILNVLFGIFIMAVINNFLNLVGVSAFLINAIKGAIIILAVLLQKKDND